jgi:hypothetical protein
MRVVRVGFMSKLPFKWRIDQGARRSSSLRRGRASRPLLSERIVAGETAAGTLVAIPVSGVALRRSLRAVRRTRPAPQGPARAFWLWLGRDIAPRAAGGKIRRLGD